MPNQSHRLLALLTLSIPLFTGSLATRAFADDLPLPGRAFGLGDVELGRFSPGAAFRTQYTGEDAPFRRSGLPQAAEQVPESEITLYGRYWRPGLHGSMYITKGGKSGTATRVNPREDLGIDEANIPVAGIRLDLSGHRFSFQYLPLEFEGKETVSDPFIFHAATYPTGQRVKSQVDFDFFVFQYDYALLRESAYSVRLGLGAYYWVFDARLKSNGPGGVINEHRGFGSILPEAHLTADFTYDLLRLGGAVGGGYLGSEQALIDAEGFIGISADPIDLDIGWRIMHFDLSATTNKGDVTIHGPFAQLSIRFH